MSQWARWRLKWPASRLFAQTLVQAQIKENIKALRHWPFVRGIHQWPVDSPHKRPVTRKLFPFDDIIMNVALSAYLWSWYKLWRKRRQTYIPMKLVEAVLCSFHEDNIQNISDQQLPGQQTQLVLSHLCHCVSLQNNEWYNSSCKTMVHYDDVIMTTIVSQITSLTVVYSTVYSDADQNKHQSSASLAFVWGIHRDRWIPRTKGQLRGKCFHLMTSSCRETIKNDYRVTNCVVHNFEMIREISKLQRHRVLLYIFHTSWETHKLGVRTLGKHCFA